MAITVWGKVKEGVVKPESPLPEGVRVQILVPDAPLTVFSETDPMAANDWHENIQDAKIALIRSLPGKYRPISAENYQDT